MDSTLVQITSLASSTSLTKWTDSILFSSVCITSLLCISVLIQCSGEYAIVQPNEVGQSGVDWNETRSPFPFWIGTVSEAVFLIGAERNSDLILGASYVSV